MYLPVNIASKVAKLKAKREKLATKLAKLDKEIEDLESKENTK